MELTNASIEKPMVVSTDPESLLKILEKQSKASERTNKRVVNALIAKGLRRSMSKKKMQSETGENTALGSQKSEIEVELTGAYRIGSNEDVEQSDRHPYHALVADDRRASGRAKSAERAQSEEKCDKEESHASLTNIDGNNSVRTLSLEARQ